MELVNLRKKIETPKYDLSGVVIDLNFEVTKDAEINIIFNEELGDVINARGNGDIAISLDDVGDVKMEGVYTVDNGEYNFALDPTNTKIAFKQKFIIEPGGSISWKGDPYDADLNLRTYYKLNKTPMKLDKRSSTELKVIQMS